MNIDINELKIGLTNQHKVEFNKETWQIMCQGDSHCLQTPNQYTLPLKINLTAMTDSTNIRLYYGLGEVIFNWECCEEELRVHDPLTGEQFGFAGKGAVPKKEFVDICWELGIEKMKIYVNGELRLESDDMPYISATKGEQNYFSSAIGVSAAWGSTITISKLNIE